MASINVDNQKFHEYIASCSKSGRINKTEICTEKRVKYYIKGGAVIDTTEPNDQGVKVNKIEKLDSQILDDLRGKLVLRI